MQGRRTDPPVSVPTATGASPAATATPEPLDEPPGVRWTRRSQGFHGVPSSALVPYPPIANSTVWVLPSTIMPASTRRRARVAVTGETRPAHGFDPPVVTRPSSSTRSFSATGMPWSGPIAVARAEGAVRALGREPGLVRVDGDERVERGIAAGDPREARLDQIDGREPAALERGRELGEGRGRRILHGDACYHARRRRAPALGLAPGRRA